MHTQRELGKYGFVAIKKGGSKRYDDVDYLLLAPAASKYGKEHKKKFTVNKIGENSYLVRRVR